MAQPWINFKTIKETVSMEHMLIHYQLLSTLTQKGSNFVGPCPIHEGTNPTQFHVSLEKNNFNCFGDCHGGGNVIDFVRKMEHIDSGDTGKDTRQAAVLIMEWFQLMPSRTPTDASPQMPALQAPMQPQAAPEPQEPRINTPLKFSLKSLDPDHSYLKERGFTPETIDEFGMGHCKKGIMAERIAIPMHNEQGELVAYAGRWPGEPPEGQGKYRLPKGFHKSLVVFNLHRAQAYSTTQGLIIVEGPFDAMWLWQAGLKNVVALMGSALSEEQEALIVRTVGPQGKVTLMFDEDEAGRAGREEALARLSHQAYVKVITLGDAGTQPDQLSAEDLTRLLG